MIKKSKVIACLYASTVAANAMEDFSQRGDDSVESSFYGNMVNVGEENQVPSTIGTMKNANDKSALGKAEVKEVDNKIAQGEANKIPAIQNIDNKQNKSSISGNNSANPKYISKYIKVEGNSTDNLYIIKKITIDDKKLTKLKKLKNPIVLDYNIFGKSEAGERISIAPEALSGLKSEYFCLNLKFLSKDDVKVLFPKNCSNMFCESSALHEVDLSGAEFSEGSENIEAKKMFYGCSNLKKVTFGEFDTSNITSMFLMFAKCPGLESLDLENFKTGKVTRMSFMFAGCSGLKNLDVSKFNTSNVTNMSLMFAGCSGLKNLDVGNFNTQSVEKMAGIFDGCSNLESLDLKNFNTQNVIDMFWMFRSCERLKNLNIKSFNTTNVTDMAEMFSGCKSLESLDVTGFNTEKVTDMAGMFSGCKSLKNLDLSNFNTGKLKGVKGMFDECPGVNASDRIKFDKFNSKKVG